MFVGDLNDVLHDWFANQDADGSVVLLRPDRFVAGIVQPQNVDTASAALRHLIDGQPKPADARETAPPLLVA